MLQCGEHITVTEKEELARGPVKIHNLLERACSEAMGVWTGIVWILKEVNLLYKLACEVIYPLSLVVFQKMEK